MSLLAASDGILPSEVVVSGNGGGSPTPALAAAGGKKPAVTSHLAETYTS